MGRAPCCAKVGLHRGPWTPREDTLLVNYIQSHGEGNWRSLPKNAGLLRCGKSCRLRWMNYLRPDIKRGNIGPDEEDLIIRLHSLLGNRWSLIAGRLPGRTDNEIKNYWNTHLSKKLLSQGTDPNTHKKLADVIINDHHRKKRSKKHQKTKQKKIITITTSADGQKPQPQLHLPKPVRVRLLNSNNNINNNNNCNEICSTNVSSGEEGTGSGAVDGILLWPEDDGGIDDTLLGGGDDTVANGGGSDFECQSDVPAAGVGGNGSLQKLYQEYLELLKTNDDHDEEGQLEELDYSFTESFLL